MHSFRKRFVKGEVTPLATPRHTTTTTITPQCYSAENVKNA